MQKLASTQYVTGPAGGNTGQLFCHLMGRCAPTGLANVNRVGCINTIKRYLFHHPDYSRNKEETIIDSHKFLLLNKSLTINLEIPINEIRFCF